MKLSEKQIQCLEYVVRGDRPLSKATVESLARKGLVEHTSLGWRSTPEGRAVLTTRSRGPQ